MGFGEVDGGLHGSSKRLGRDNMEEFSVQGNRPKGRSMPLLDDEVMSAFLTPKIVYEISGNLLRSSDQSARFIGTYIEDSLPDAYFRDTGIDFPIMISAAAAPEPKNVLDAAIRHATKLGETIPKSAFPSRLQSTKNWGLALLQECFIELRHKICGKGKNPAPLGVTAHSALAALGTLISKLLGISNPIGMGIAVLVITNAARIGKTALCKMTTTQELAKYFL